MNSNTLITYGWYPSDSGGETQNQRESRITRDWLREALPESAQWDWLRRLRGGTFPTRETALLCQIGKHDTPELIDLLYPKLPQLFHTARQYSLPFTLLANLCDAPFSPEVLQQLVNPYTAQLDALCFFAFTGSLCCLEALLEHGADPNGLEISESWSYLELSNNRILPVSPMDCALLAGNEDCQFALELFGGRSLHDNLTA